MQKQDRTTLLRLIGFLVGVLVAVVALRGRESASAGAGARNGTGNVFVNLMEHLGFLPARRCAGSPRNGCIAQLKQIDGAKAVWALENKKLITDVPTATDLYGTNAYIRDEPKCPLGGKYVIGSVQQKPRCSIPGHTL
jgi:hypothetical protein